MPDVTITGLPDATTPLSGTERVAMDQSGVTRDATAQDIANLPHNQAWSTITSTPTTLSGYGIADALPLDFSTLTTLP